MKVAQLLLLLFITSNVFSQYKRDTLLITDYVIKKEAVIASVGAGVISTSLAGRRIKSTDKSVLIGKGEEYLKGVVPKSIRDKGIGSLKDITMRKSYTKWNNRVGAIGVLIELALVANQWVEVKRTNVVRQLPETSTRSILSKRN